MGSVREVPFQNRHLPAQAGVLNPANPRRSAATPAVDQQAASLSEGMRLVSKQPVSQMAHQKGTSGYIESVIIIKCH
jgi:hypothetical protein